MSDMKITEKQLAGLFQNHSKEHVSSSDASDCLGTSAASAQRISHVEDIANDRSSAAAMKVALSLKDWSQVMAQSIENTRQSWFSFLGMSSPMKTAFATVAFAFAFAVALPKFSSQEDFHSPISQVIVVENDIINNMKFDSGEPSDHLMKMSFEGNGQKPDQLFDGNFG